jgi:hypothetical protein
MSGVFKRALLIIFTSFSTFFIILWTSQRMGVKRRRRVQGWTSFSTIVKSEAAEACISMTLLHRIFYYIESHPFFKRLNFWAFFSLGSNGRARRLQIQMNMDLFYGLGVLLPGSVLVLSFHIGGMLRLAQAKHHSKWRRGLLPLLPIPSSPRRWGTQLSCCYPPIIHQSL